jgi:hypothetical protein
MKQIDSSTLNLSISFNSTPQSDQSFTEIVSSEGSLSVDRSVSSSNSSVLGSFSGTPARALERSALFLSTFQFTNTCQQSLQDPPHGLSDNVKTSVSLWIGVVVAVLVLLIVIGLVVWRLNRRKETDEIEDAVPSEFEMDRYHEEDRDHDSLSDFCHESFGGFGRIGHLWDDSLSGVGQMGSEEGFM